MTKLEKIEARMETAAGAAPRTRAAGNLPDWLANMSAEHRKAYLAEHPNSKYASKL